MYRLDDKRQTRLIYVCFAIYASSYLAKLNFNALLVEILRDLGGARSAAGLVGSFFFFSYGIGQVVNGFIAKYTDERVIMTASLFGSALCNLAMSFAPSIGVMKYIWLLNGIVMSPLWCNIVKVQGKYISQKNLPKSLSIIGLTTPVGTALNYGICAAFAAFSTWKMSFRFAAVLMTAMSLLWFAVIGDVKRSSSPEPDKQAAASKADDSSRVGKSLTVKVAVTLGAMFLAGAFTQFTREGLNAWVPSILTEVYNMPSTLSIALTLLLPLLGSVGNFLLVVLERRCRNFLALSILFTVVAAAFTVILTVSFSPNSFVITFACFIIVCACCATLANITTNHLPLYYRDRFDTGRMAGIGQGFCYIGSTLSTYTLGYVADRGGWNSVFVMLSAVVSVSAVICITVACLSSHRKASIKPKA